MKSALLFLYYYLCGSLRLRFFEFSPGLYQKIFLALCWRRIKRKFSFYHDMKAFAEVPVMSKKVFLSNFPAFNAFALDYENCLRLGLIQEETRKFKREPEGYTIGLSSGTSGKRGVFLTTDQEQLKWSANLFTHLSWFSFFKKYRIAFFLRANSPMYEKVSRSKRISFKFFDLLHPIDKLRQTVSEFDPTVIVAPPAMLQELLALKELDKSRLSGVSIIVSVADVLDPYLEQKLKEAFRCPVHQIYQATEGFLAATCRFEKLHLNEDLIYFEKDSFEEKTHRFAPILTDYLRESQAIVRYRLDDILVFDPHTCKCGSKRMALKSIEGRADEILDFGGIKIFPDFIRNAIQNSLLHSIDFCVVRDEQQLMVKLGGGPNPMLEQALQTELRKLFAKFGVTVNFEINFEFNFQRDLSVKCKRVFNSVLH